ncbi:MAG: FAD-binding oxidoreductase [Dehalococcoidia bacterium]|jgi:FAD/FMN-containing dehydrogenase|nr:FAD-binding oxidoreductase [Dehalococcoidia bacterium]
MEPAEFLGEVTQIVSRDQVFTDEQTLSDYTRDAVRHERWGLEAPRAPLAVVRPGSTAHVSEIMKLATRVGTPVVPYGAGTGVMGGAVSMDGGIVLDMGSMDKVLDISLEDRLARVQPGVILGELDKLAQVGGMFVGHDPWSQPVASVGGAVSTNGVGYMAAKYGTMGRQVLALEVVLPTGEVVRTRELPRNVSTGLDMTSLFIGTDGAFGVITEATIRLFPQPEERRHYALEFPSFPSGFFAICRFATEGIIPAMVDFAEEEMTEEGGQAIEADAPGRSVLHMSLEGSSSMEVDALEGTIWEIVSNYSGKDLGPAEAQRFWEERHAAGERYADERGTGQRHPWREDGGGGFAYIHTAVPISQVLNLRYQGIPLFQSEGFQVKEVAIWGEPEMFSIIATDPGGSDRGREKMREVSDRFIDLALEMGGTVEYCHGVGLRMKGAYGRELGAGGRELIRRLKTALDPSGILNPGKLLD